ncbi:50S ribosomal protein L23 [Candidatus Peregrinibacteria bacterium]|nr:50S ribosomal protein L23 [Candidatus Peregrinibacteria bacterium]
MEASYVLITPVVTEKSAKAQTARKYTFLVHLDANKKEIQGAIEGAYGVKVERVNILPVLAKSRIAGKGRITKRQQARKAIVTLAPKQSIDFNKIKVA